MSDGRKGLARGLLVTVGILAAAVAPARETVRELEEADFPGSGVPQPPLDSLEPEVRRHLDEAMERVAAAGENPELLPEALGALGQVYYLYDFTESARAAFEAAASEASDDFRWHYYLGALARLDGLLEAAVAHLERALELQPDDVPALTRLADVRLELGERERARELYLRAEALEPGSAAVQYGLGRIAEYEGEHERAIERFERALALQPAATSVHYRLGLAHRELGNREEARRQMSLNRGDRVRMQDPLIDAIGALVQGGEVYFRAGVEASKRGEFEEAIALFRRAEEESPEDAQVQYNLSLALGRLERHREAQAALERAIEIDPEFRNAHFNLGLALAEQGDLAGAERHFGTAHRIDPEDVDSHLEWATALALLGRRPEAIAELEELVTRVPGAAAAHERLGRLLDGVGRSEAALDHLATAVELEPERIEARSTLATLLGRQGRFLEAAAQFEAVIEEDGSRLETHFGAAMARLLGDDEAGARQRLEASVAALPGTTSLEHLLARVLATAGSEAARDGERSLELATSVMGRERTIEHAQTVAMALAELGRFDEAAALQEQVVQQLAGGGGATTARQRLDGYRRGEPCRRPWSGS